MLPTFALKNVQGRNVQQGQQTQFTNHMFIAKTPHRVGSICHPLTACASPAKGGRNEEF